MKLIDLLTIACLGLVVVEVATALGSAVDDRLGQAETLLDRYGRDNVFVRLEISDLKYEDGISKQKMAKLVQDNKSFRADIFDVENERQEDREEIKKLKSQGSSLKEELEGAVCDIDHLKIKIQEVESCGCSGSPVTPVASTSLQSTTEMTTWPINAETEFINVGHVGGRLGIFKDLSMLVVGGPVAVNEIYDLRTRKLVRTFDKGFPIVFKQNQLIIAPTDGPITIWNVETGELVSRLEGTYKNTIQSVALNKDQSLMLTGGEDNAVILWDMIELKQVRKFTGHTDWIRSIVFDEARNQVISGSWDKTIRVWNMNDGSLVRTIKGHSDWISKLLLDEETGRLFSASYDGTIKEWNIESGTELRAFIGHSNWVRDLIFSEDGQRLISSSWDNSIIIWDKKSGEQIKRLNYTEKVVNLALNPLNGQLISTIYSTELIFWPVKP